MARGAAPEAGPTGRRPGRVAAELRTLAADDRVAVHRVALEELAEDLPLPDRLARWAGTDLVAAYAARDTFLPSPAARKHSSGTAAGPSGRRRGRRDRAARLTRALAGAGSALVFLPLLLTWAGLGAAAWAYQDMRAEGKGDGETFLALWQLGFAGHLPLPFHFDFLVAYTVTALCCLVLATALRQRHERADDLASRVLAARLSGALAQVQALAAEAAQATPLRFGEELRGAARNLRALGELAGRAQQETAELIAEARRTSSLTRDAALSLGEGVRELRSAAGAVASSTDSASRAAQEARQGAQLLSGEAGKVVDGMDRAVRRAAGAAAEELSAAAADAVRRVADAAEAAAGREETAARRNAELLRRSGEDMTGAFAAARVALESAAGELAATVERLDRTVTGLPLALESSAAEGAERIGWAYDQAVVALAATLREDVRTVCGELAGHVVQLRELSRLREETDREAGDRSAHTARELRVAVEEFHAVLHDVAGLLRDATDTLTRPAPPATDASPKTPAEPAVSASDSPTTTSATPAEPAADGPTAMSTDPAAPAWPASDGPTTTSATPAPGGPTAAPAEPVWPASGPTTTSTAPAPGGPTATPATPVAHGPTAAPAEPAWPASGPTTTSATPAPGGPTVTPATPAADGPTMAPAEPAAPAADSLTAMSAGPAAPAWPASDGPATASTTTAADGPTATPATPAADGPTAAPAEPAWPASGPTTTSTAPAADSLTAMSAGPAAPAWLASDGPATASTTTAAGGPTSAPTTTPAADGPAAAVAMPAPDSPAPAVAEPVDSVARVGSVDGVADGTRPGAPCRTRPEGPAPVDAHPVGAAGAGEERR
ncbi:hypothetical protein [Streptomyces asoensis]|uniref:hypothetical protein n=1 Tax=Streptomyces asoensis TaxID=249586 RepID=UPI0033FF0BC1